MLREGHDGESRILPFCVPPSRRTVRTAEAAGMPATVLLFTGVRYARPEEATDVVIEGETPAAQGRTDN